MQFSSLKFFAAALVFVAAGFLLPMVAEAQLANGSCSDAQHARVMTEHTARVAGRTLSYTTTVGFIEVTSNDRTSKACVFYTSYELQPANHQTRPITFAFNGGPGSSSVWLHLGLLGPKRADMGADGLQPPAQPELIANDDSLLDVSDIVTIDPVATGFSHTEAGASGDHFFGVRNDYTSIAEFIRTYLNSYNRWNSPKFIMGESYGGIRGPLLTNYLQSTMNIRINGLILISPALSNTNFFSVDDNMVPYWIYFPSFAATAWYHHLLAPSLEAMPIDQFFASAQQFASTRLRDALDQGVDLSAQDADEIAEQMSAFLGFPKAYILAHHLRITDQDEFYDLRGTNGMMVGRYDSRFTALSMGRTIEDPSGTIPGFVYASGINDYLRTELGFTQPSPYNIFGDINAWPEENEVSLDVMPSLSAAMSNNPQLKVLIANGYFDLACPLGGASYSIRHMPNAAALRSRITHTAYFGGHMMYINPLALHQLKGDIVRLMQ